MRSTISSDPEIREILSRIRRRENVRHVLPGGGVLSVDRGLPYLLVYREPRDMDDPGTSRLVSGEASYLMAAAGGETDVAGLVAAIAEAGSEVFGAFLVLEIWAAGDPAFARFIVHGPEGPAPETVGALVDGLEGLRDLRPELEVAVAVGEARHPPGLPPLLAIRESWETGILLLGLEVPPLHRDGATGRIFPRFLRRFQQRLSPVLRQALYEFLRVQTSCRVENYRALGTSTAPESVREIDRELSAIERSFELLLLTAPVNEEQAWRAFREGGFERSPEFHYRLLPVDPDLLKRRLYAVRIEEIDDPALASLYQEKREELDREIGMLDERGSPGFRFSSMRRYGTVDDTLLEQASGLLAGVPPSTKSSDEREEWIDARGFRDEAAAEFRHYAKAHPPILERTVEVRPDVRGLMVSEGNLLIGEGLRLSPGRVPALLHHEVGTHVLTYVNGSAQPLEQLALGLADYDELQEGLAVLAEYLVGGLDGTRMRLLAARVLVAHACEQGASFVDAFRLLHTGHGFSRRGAWNVTTRVYQCGGFTRDLIYLRGLIGLMEYLRAGEALEPLYVGKIALRHVPIIDELRHRAVLREPPLSPRVLAHPLAQARLEAVRGGITLAELICPESA